MLKSVAVLRTLFPLALICSIGIGCNEPPSQGVHESRPVIGAPADSSKDKSPFPVRWRIGNVDPRFHVTEVELRRAVSEATDVWEQAAGEDLFSYDEVLGLPISLKFDQRQQFIIDGRQAEGKLTALRSALKKRVTRYESLTSELNADIETYNVEVKEYQDRMKSHNSRVAYYNERGGAPTAEFEELEAESDDLRRVKYALDEEDSRLAGNRQEAEALNAAIDSQRGVLNRQVDSYNRSYAGKVDTAGLYSRLTTKDGSTFNAAITVFEVQSLHHLAYVLAHELGHALGLSHVLGRDSLMSERHTVESGARYLLKLSPADLDALRQLFES